MYKSTLYLLAGPLNPDYDYIQYWSISEGWVTRDQATKFTEEETKLFDRPANSLGWVKYYEVGYKDIF